MIRDIQDSQPYVDAWPMWDEPLSKIPCQPVPVDIAAARLRLARRFNSGRLPKEIEMDIAWHEHALRRTKEISR